MKKFQKMMALLLVCLMMVGVMSMGAWATGDVEPSGETGSGEPSGETGSGQTGGTTSGLPGSITVKPSDTVSLTNKTLKAYKILDATYSPATTALGENDEQAIAYSIPAVLISFYDDYFSDKTDAENIKTASQLAAAAGKTLAAYVTGEMANWADDAEEIKNFEYAAIAAAKAAGITPTAGAPSGNNVVFSGLAAGYYVIEDEGAAVPISALMLDTVTDANVEIALKASDESEKEVMTAEELVNTKANELGLGRTVNYKVTQKVPDTTGYEYYYYMINDTLSNGLTFDPNSVVVKVGTTTLTKGTDYYLYADKTADAAVLGTKTFIVAFANVVADKTANKYKTGDDITVTYNATINGDAVSGVDPNTNQANITYSNNPDKDGKGDFENHPGIPANDGNHPTGEGPTKWTDTYTGKISIEKTDGATDEALPGVEFTLTGTATDAVFNEEEVFEVDPDGTYWLLTNGTYTTTAPQTEPTLEATTREAGWVALEANEEVTEGTPIRVVAGTSYRPYVAATDSAKTHYVIIEANSADYTSTTTKYAKTTKTADAAESYSVSRTGVTGDDGKLDFSQLGAGTYTLSENGVLAGYNAIPDITFTLTCTLPDAEAVIAGEEKATWTITTNTPNASFVEQTDGTFKISIENNQGSELPSTGGIGTTIFYVVGGVLVVAAGVLLVTKRRMGVEK